MTEYNTLGEALDANKIKNAAEKKARTSTVGQTVKEMTPDQIVVKYAKRRRNGKTAKDHTTGSHRATMTNRLARDKYVQWSKGSESRGASFDQSKAKAREYLASCNGQKSRSLKSA